jgi:hypothetical protein
MISFLIAAIWITPLVMDTICFGLTLYRSWNHLAELGRARYVSTSSFGCARFSSITSRTLRTFVLDGALYFLVIFSVNLMNTIVYFVRPLYEPLPRTLLRRYKQTASQDFRTFAATFWQIITSIMISRMVLNIRAGISTTNDTILNPNATIGTSRIVNKALAHLTFDDPDRRDEYDTHISDINTKKWPSYDEESSHRKIPMVRVTRTVHTE